MADIKKILRELIVHYSFNRRVGHTTLMKRGTSNFELKKLVLVMSNQMGSDLKIPKSERITLDTLDKLKGTQLPLAIDNATLLYIFSNSIEEFSRLEYENKELHSKYWKEKVELMNKYENEIRWMKKHPFKTFFKSIWQR